MASIRASGYKSYDFARIKARIEFREYVRRFSGFYEAEREALEFDGVRTRNMSALAKWDAEQASNTWIRQALRKDKVYKRNGMIYDPSAARQTMEEMVLETYRRAGSPATDGRGSGFFRAKSWTPYEAPARRLNPLAAGGASRPAAGRGLGTSLSRFADTKGGIGSGGLFGASASRVRSAKEMVNNPSTFFRRALVYYIADEVGRGYANARGWDKISYLDTPEEAERKLNPEGTLAAVGRGAAGAVVGGLSEVGKPFVRASAILMSAVPSIGEANAARKFALYEANIEWANGGFRGPSPYEIMDAYPGAVTGEIKEATAKAVGKAHRKFSASVDRTIDRMQDALAARGVGTIEQIKSRYRRSTDGQRALSGMLKQELAQLDPDEIHNRALNKLKQQK